MATATETKNGVQNAADETSKATIKAYDAMTEYYLTALDAGLKFQARWIETTKLLLDESAAFQRANRKLAEEMVVSARKVQQDVLGSVDTNLRAAQAFWVPESKR